MSWRIQEFWSKAKTTMNFFTDHSAGSISLHALFLLLSEFIPVVNLAQVKTP